MSSVTWFIPSAPISDITVEADLPAGKVDHVAAAIARLPEQFKNKTKIVNLVKALCAPATSLEDALWQLLTERAVDTAIGTQLDQLGFIVGQERGGLSDVDYRRFIRARIAANRSQGVTEDLIRVANLVLNNDAATVEVETQNGTVVVRLRSVTTDDSLAAIMLSFLQDSKSGGIRVILESYVDVDAEMFTTAQTMFGTGPFAPAVTEMAVYSTGAADVIMLAFPDTGSVIIDEGTTVAETKAYTFRGFEAGTMKFKFSSGTANAHPDNCSISLTGATARGKGLGDHADPGQPTTTPYSNIGTTGGRMADARN